MSKLPPKDKPLFVTFTERRQEFIVCSRVEHWVSHWDQTAGKSRRCAGSDCHLCHLGVPRVTRFVVMALDTHNRECLIEMRERHRHILEQLEASVTNGEGVRITCRKEGTAKNSPVTVTILGHEAVFRREIQKLVDTFGLPPLRMTFFRESQADELQPDAVNVDSLPLQRNPE